MVSIRDVARIAGVSPATVSRVMNETARVDEEKKQRVLNAIQETGFKPNEVARSLFKKSSRIIGMIVPNIENPFFNELAKAIEEETYLRGYRLTLCNSNNDLEKEKKNLSLLDRMNADGIILMTNQEKMEKEVQKCRIPVVMIDRQLDGGVESACIQSDHYSGGRLAMEHLISCGCRHIVQMRGPLKFSSARQRYQGYQDVCRERGLQEAVIDCRYDYEEGLHKAKEILEKFPDTDGIIAANDMVAISVYKVLAREGLGVPQDIQLIGFDNISLSRLMTPELTTISQPIGEMGKAAVEALIDAVEGKQPVKKVFKVELIKRETTKKIMEEHNNE